MKEWKNNSFNIDDMNLSPAQKEAWKELDSNLKEDNSCLILPAGAGAGKTHLMSVFISSLIAKGCSPDSINAISFTNLSAEELQIRVIGNQKSILNNFYNMDFNTIHSHAFNMLRTLAPHIHGLQAPFEKNLNTFEENKNRFIRTLKLSMLSSYQDGLKQNSIMKFMTPYIFPCGELEDDVEIYFSNCKRKRMDGFLSSDSNDLSYPIAVATEALLHIKNKVDRGDLSKDFFEIIKIPHILILDEAQDIDITQLMYLRALNRCGTDIVMVGDKNQTLYRWRYALGELIFSKTFMHIIFEDINVKILHETPLNENWRSRKEILEFSDFVVKKIRDVETDNYLYFRSMENNDNISMIPQQEIHLDQSSVSVIAEIPAPQKTDKIRFRENFVPIEPKKENYLNILSQHSNSKMKKLIDKRDVNRIFQWFRDIKNRILDGDSAVVITNHNVSLDDVNLIKQIMNYEVPVVKVSSEKCVPLSSTSVISKTNDQYLVKTGIPLSNFMVAMTIHFILDDIETLENNVMEKIKCHPNIEHMEQYLKSELGEYIFNYYMTKIKDYCHDLLNTNIPDVVLHLTTQFTISVLAKYASINWLETFKGKSYEGEELFSPYRFSTIVSKQEKSLYSSETVIRPANEQKRMFQWMWTALTSTYFPYSQYDLNMTSFVNDITDYGLNLSNIGIISCNKYIEQENIPSKFVNDLIRNRENSYEAIMNSYNSPLRSWLTMIFNEIEKRLEEDNPDIKLVYKNVYDEYMEDINIRMKKNIITTGKRGRANIRGLLKSFISSNEEQTMMKRTLNRIDGSLELSTIHASKGMEWDHVLYITADGYKDINKNDDDVSFLAITHHDNNYVTMTRAKKTLTIAVSTQAAYGKTNNSSFPEEIIDKIYMDTAKELDVLNKILKYGSSDILKTKKNNNYIVKHETNHSEIEVAMKCEQAYDLEYRRAVKSISLLPSLTYPIFFHSFMSEIVATLSHQRIADEFDDISAIASVIKLVIQKNIKKENEILEIFKKENFFINVIKDLVPGYLYNTDSIEYVNLLTYYSDGLQKHLASIISGSKLFNLLIEAQNNNGHVLVEKTMRNIMYHDKNVLPFQGVPDVCILFPDKCYFFDYKSVPNTKNSKKSPSHISLNVVLQLTIYTGLTYKEGMDIYSEAIYVQDITARNDQITEIPKLKEIQGSYGFISGPNTEHARIIYSNSFNKELFKKTGNIINEVKDLAEKQDEDLASINLRETKPACSLGEDESFSIETCMGCSQNRSCAKSKIIAFYDRSGRK